MRPRVVVVGGGPAGSVTAALLAEAGIDTVLLERKAFPRHKVGESLQPAAIEALDARLGLGPAIAAQGFARKYGAVYVWGESRAPWSVLFDERLDRDLPGLDESQLLAGDYEHAWNVDRAVFDQILLEEAGRRGVEIREGAVAAEPILDGGRVVGVSLRGGEQLRASVVVDATGQAAWLGRSLGLLEEASDLRATATYAWLDGAGGLPGPLARHVQYVVTVPDGWVWFIPISSSRTSVGVVSRHPRRLTREAFDAAVRRAELPLEGAVGVPDAQGRVLRFARDWSFAQSRMAGPGWLLVGDAACFVDPILSGGVDFAVRGGCSAADVILRSLQADPASSSALLAAYDAEVRRDYRAYLRLARYWYGNNRSVEGLFWEAHAEIPPGSASTPLRAFVYLTSGRYAADRHKGIFQGWQERRMFDALGVDRAALERVRTGRN